MSTTTLNNTSSSSNDDFKTNVVIERTTPSLSYPKSVPSSIDDDESVTQYASTTVPEDDDGGCPGDIQRQLKPHAIALDVTSSDTDENDTEGEMMSMTENEELEADDEKEEIKNEATPDPKELKLRINGKWINKNWNKSIAVTYEAYKKKYERNCRLPMMKKPRNLWRTFYTIRPSLVFEKKTQRDFPWFFSWVLTLVTFFIFDLFRKIILVKLRKSWLAENIKSHKIKLLENEHLEDDHKDNIRIKARPSPRLYKNCRIKDKILNCLSKVGIHNMSTHLITSPHHKLGPYHHLQRIPSDVSLNCGTSSQTSSPQSAISSSMAYHHYSTEESPRSSGNTSSGEEGILAQEEEACLERMTCSTFNPLDLKIEEQGEITSLVDFLTHNSVICPSTTEMSRFKTNQKTNYKRYHQNIKSRRLSNNEDDMTGSNITTCCKPRRNSNNSTSSLDIIMTTTGVPVAAGRSWTGARSGEFYISNSSGNGGDYRSPAASSSLQHSIEKYIQALDIQRAETTPENVLKSVTESVKMEEMSRFKTGNGDGVVRRNGAVNEESSVLVMTPRRDFVIDRINSNDDQFYKQYTGYKSGISLELTKMENGQDDRKSTTSNSSSTSIINEFSNVEEEDVSKLDMILVSKRKDVMNASGRGDVEMVSMFETPRIPDDVSRPVMAKVHRPPALSSRSNFTFDHDCSNCCNCNDDCRISPNVHKDANAFKNDDVKYDSMLLMDSRPITFEINITEYKDPVVNDKSSTITTNKDLTSKDTLNKELIKDKNTTTKNKESPATTINKDLETKASPEPKPEAKKVAKKAPRAAPPPPPPPMKSKRKPGSKAASNTEGDSPILRNATVIELFKEVRNNSMGRNSNGKLAKTSSNASSCLSAQPSSDSFVKELEKNSKHFAKIQQEITQMSDMINKTISEINNNKYKTMGELDIFVAKIDRMLDSLTDESAVLKHFDWPSKYYTYREALSMWQEFRNMKASLTNWKKGKGNVQTELSRMQKAMEKTISRFDVIMQTYEGDKEKYKKNNIPWDHSVVVEVRHASVLLMDVYMSTLLTEYKNAKPVLKKKNRSKNIQSFQDTVKLAFKMHQFAGGLSKSSPVLVEEIALTLRKLISGTEEEEDA